MVGSMDEEPTIAETRTRMHPNADILVAGGGPAGCTVALGLVALGHRVRLITRPRPPSVEGLSERVLRALEASGCRRALAAIGPAVRREASWSGATTAANQEWVVPRSRLDVALLEDAAAAGVEVVDGRITRIERAGQGWCVEAGHDRGWWGGYLVEARGRRAPGRRLRGPATTALGRLFASVPSLARTAVAGFSRGWAWYAATGDGTGFLQIVLSSAEPLPKRAALPAFFESLLDEIGPARHWLGRGRAVGEVFARHAEASRAALPIEQRLIRVGDAALAIDPLSGHGVFEAIASAKAAVSVVNTTLRHPDDAELARSFYEERVRLAFERFARIGRDFYALERRWPDAVFWRERRQWPDDRPAHAPPLADPPRIESRPVVENGFIVARRVVVTADQPRGVWQVDGVPIVDLLDWRRRHDGDDLPAVAAARFACTPQQVATALQWLRYRRLIG
jgi:menaquinone-9 beta-reductase